MKNTLAFFIFVSFFLQITKANADLVIKPEDLKSKKNLKQKIEKKVDTLTSHQKDKPKWFGSVTSPTLVKINSYKQAVDQKPEFSADIKSTEFIRKLVELINRIPTQGDIMVSFAGNIEMTTLVFSDEQNKKIELQIFGNGFKTPSTAFNSNKGSDEKSALMLIQNLKNKGFDKTITLIEGLEYDFKEFILLYAGEKKSEPAPVTSSFTVRSFKVKSTKSKQMIEFTVTAGQLSPPDTEFSIDGQTYILKTHGTIDLEKTPSHRPDSISRPQNQKETISLYPSYFMILRK